MRRISLLAIVVAVATACSGQQPTTRTDRAGTTIRVASYDFTESLLLAQMYAVALRANGFHVQVVPELGSREIVDPALLQGAVDVIPEYVGTALNFLAGTGSRPATTVRSAYTRLRTAFLGRGAVTLNYAPAQDQNGFVVDRRSAAQRGWTQLSDLKRVAPSLVFGGPPECAERALCLRGLRDTYGLRFREFRPFDQQSVTAQALLTGEIGVGLLDTTNCALTDRRLLLLRDDRHLQPVENVVPVVSLTAFRRAGPRLAGVLNDVSAHLHTSDLVVLNCAVEAQGRDPRVVATGWLREQGLLPVRK